MAMAPRTLVLVSESSYPGFGLWALGFGKSTATPLGAQLRPVPKSEGQSPRFQNGNAV